MHNYEVLQYILAYEDILIFSDELYLLMDVARKAKPTAGFCSMVNFVEK